MNIIDKQVPRQPVIKPYWNEKQVRTWVAANFPDLLEGWTCLYYVHLKQNNKNILGIQPIYPDFDQNRLDEAFQNEIY